MKAISEHTAVKRRGENKGENRGRTSTRPLGVQPSKQLKKVAQNLVKLLRSRAYRPKVSSAGSRIVVTLDDYCSYLVYQSKSTCGVVKWRIRGIVSDECMKAITAAGFRFGKEHSVSKLAVWQFGESPEAKVAWAQLETSKFPLPPISRVQFGSGIYGLGFWVKGGTVYLRSKRDYWTISVSVHRWLEDLVQEAALTTGDC